ncbi:MAG: hypothetical protein E7652_06170 [Ruminococcaceae bacterium]|nr:hypothetical protein [Oscillospiraceae bacterium]
MKEYINRIISLFLVVLMLIPMISAMGITASASSVSGTCGDNITWTLDTSTGQLDISGTGDINPKVYNYSKPAWCNYRAYIKTVNIGDQITGLGISAFEGCTLITSVSIPDSVTSIGERTFYECRRLESISISDTVTSIDQMAFYGCSALASISIPDSVTSIGPYAFYNCSMLISVDLPDSVTEIGFSAFKDCTSLSNIMIPDSVENIGHEVLDGTALYNTSSNWENDVLYIGNHLLRAKTSVKGSYSIKKGTLTIAEQSFTYCSLLNEVIIPDSVTNIGASAFFNCTALGNVKLSDSLKCIRDSVFRNCDSLVSINIPDSVISIGKEAFYNCPSLKSVTLGNNVTSIGFYAFYNCTSLENINIPDSVTSIGGDTLYNTAYLKNADNWEDGVLYIGKHLIRAKTFVGASCSIKEGTLTVAAWAFFDCKKLDILTIPDSVIYIGEEAFYYNTDIEGYARLKVLIKCYKDSYAHAYAVKGRFTYELICNHSFTTYISDNNYTCLEDGTKTAHCDNGCGLTDTIIDVGSKKHNYEINILREGTCMQQGIDMYICKTCSDYYTVTTPIIEHLFTEYVFDNNATCMNYGTKTAYCDYGCGTLNTVVAETDLVHSFTNYKSDNNADCINDGTKTAYCDYGCGATNTVTDVNSKLDHRFTDYISNNDFSCTKDGTETAYCDFGCGTVDTKCDVGSKIAHEYTEELLEMPTCSEEGLVLYVCSLCRDFYTETVSKTEHIGEWIVTVKPTVTEDGKKILKCTVCGELLDTEIINKLPKNEFYDVINPEDWYYNAVYYCASRGYIQGNEKGQFMPDGKLTREQFVVILARVAGADLTQYSKTDFTDVKIGSWYAPSVAWASKNGYVNGIGNGKFGVGKNIDRESLATLFYRYAEKQGINVSGKADMTGYSDYAKISSWSKDACAWAVKAGLLSSTDTKVLTLSPRMTVTRSQAARIFMNYDNKVLG